MKITVLVPTYRRPADLARCLEALSRQERGADEVIVVARADDQESWHVLAPWRLKLPLVAIEVYAPGQVHALNAGIQRATAADIISITDDDAAPHPDWLSRIEAHFIRDPTIGGVGGRDWVHQGGGIEDDSRAVVGKVEWYGRVIGNHHLGVGEARYVDVLKGANMSYRTAAIAGLKFDESLRGTGAQVHNDLSFSLEVRRKGWKLLYDPLVAIDHYPAERFDEDKRATVHIPALTNATHNETVALLRYLTPIQRPIFMGWALLIGTRVAPGILQMLRLQIHRTPSVSIFWAVQAGRGAGWRTWRQAYKAGKGAHSSER